MDTSHRFTTAAPVRWGATGLILLALGTGGSCRRSSTDQGELLPGRSRQVLETDWPHPREYDFGAGEFEAPDPASALLETEDGIRAYVVADPTDPLVRISAVLPLGRLHERGEPGASHLLVRLLTGRGSTASSRAFSLRLDSLGAELMVEELLDATRISVEVLATDWREGLILLLDQLQEVPLDEDAIRAYRTGIGYAAITSGVSGESFRPKVELERILGGYPLAPPDPGLSVEPSSVRNLASRAIQPDRIVLGVGGAVTKSEVEAALSERKVGGPREGREPEVKTRDANPPSSFTHRLDVPGLVGWIAIGRTVGPLLESERAPLAVLADVLNTRLNIATREVRGLSNRTVFMLPDSADGSGLLHVRSGGRPEAVAPLIHFTREEMLRLARWDEPITDDELEMAKGALIRGEWQKSLDGARQASATYALEAVRHGGTGRLAAWPSAIRAVPVDEVKRVAEKYLHPDSMVTVVVGPIQKIREARHPRWPVDFDAIP